MIAMVIVKSTYANEHLFTSFPALRRCTVNSYNVNKNLLTITDYTDSFRPCQPFYENCFQKSD